MRDAAEGLCKAEVSAIHMPMSDRRSDPSIPNLDLERFNGSAQARTAFLGDLRDAARQVGFFHLIGHGIEATWSTPVSSRCGAPPLC